MAVDDRIEPVAQIAADGGHPVQETRFQHHVQDRVADRHGQRIPAIGGTVAAGAHSLRGPLGRQKGTERKPAADALGDAHHIGGDPGPFMGEQLAGAAIAGLDLVKVQQKAELVADLPQGPEIVEIVRPDPAFPLDRFDMDGGGLIRDRRPQLVEVAERDLIEAVDHRPETVDQLRRLGGRDRGQGAAVKRTADGDDPPAAGGAGSAVILADQLDAAFPGFDTGIAEEHRVGETVRHQPFGQPLLIGDAVEVGDMPQHASLPGQRIDQMGMAVAEAVHRDAGREIQISSPVGGEEERALAPLERDIGPRIGRHNGWDHDWVGFAAPPMCFCRVRVIAGRDGPVFCRTVASSNPQPPSPQPCPVRCAMARTSYAPAAGARRPVSVRVSGRNAAPSIRRSP